MGPLTGYRVLELGSTVAGPFCGRLLADFGAEVLKIEAIDGDTVRSMGKRFEGKSLYAASIFRNKRMLAVDLRKPAGQDVIKQLVAHCDITVENFRPGGLEKWGLGFDELTKVRPDLIMVRISGYGQDGPYAQRPGYGVISEALSGLRYVTGDPDRPPARVGVSLTDYVSGLYAAFGAMLALLHRHRTGQGQVVDTALYECAFSLMEPHVPAFDKLGAIAKRAGARLPDNTPNNLYPALGGQYIHITAPSDPIFRRFAHQMGQPELADDPRFETAIERSANEDELDGIIAKWTASRNAGEIEACLNAAQVPAARIATMKDIFEDPHFQARGMLTQMSSDEVGEVTLAGVVPKLSATPGRIDRAGGAIGRDTRCVLAELGGLPPEVIEQLERDGVIYCGEPPL